MAGFDPSAEVKGRVDIRKPYERDVGAIAPGDDETLLVYWPYGEDARPRVEPDDYCANWAAQLNDDWEDDPSEH